MDCSTPVFPVLHHLPELAQTHVHWVGDAIQSSHPLSPLSPPALNLSQHQGLFQWVSSSPRWPKYWSFSFNISPSNEHPGLISFRMDGLDLLAVRGTLKSLLQHHSSKASILQPSAFFIVQLSHPYIITGKTVALTRRTFVAFIRWMTGTSLVVQWIKLCTSNVGGVGSVPGLGTKIHVQCSMAKKLKKENDGKRGNKCLSSNYAIYTLKNCVKHLFSS